MAMTVGGKKGAPEINVTPLVDVVLVLLIIFMVLSPAALNQLRNALPQAATVETSAVLTRDQLLVELRPGEKALFEGRALTMTDLEAELRRRLAERTSRTVFFKVDDTCSYGATVAWMAATRRAGATTIALSLDPATAEPGGSP